MHARHRAAVLPCVDPALSPCACDPLHPASRPLLEPSLPPATAQRGPLAFECQNPNHRQSVDFLLTVSIPLSRRRPTHPSCISARRIRLHETPAQVALQHCGTSGPLPPKARAPGESCGLQQMEGAARHLPWHRTAPMFIVVQLDHTPHRGESPKWVRRTTGRLRVCASVSTSPDDCRPRNSDSRQRFAAPQ